MKTQVLQASIAVGLACALAAPQARGQAKDVRIAFIAKSEANAVFAAAELGAKAEARELSRRLGISIEVEVLTPPKEDAAEQARRVALAADQGFDAIAIACSDAATVGPAVDAAVDRGLAVMTFDSDCGTKRFSHYGPDDRAAGAAVMKELAAMIGGSGRVAVLGGNLEAPNLELRAAGAKEAARELGLELVGAFAHQETPQEAVAEVLRVNRSEPGIAGWVMLGGWPLFRSSGTPALLEDLRARNQKVAAIDALPDQLHWVEKGMAILLAQPVYDWGRVSVSTIVDKVHGGKDPPAVIRMELVRVGPDSLGTWARQLRDWGFAGLPDQYLKMN